MCLEFEYRRLAAAYLDLAKRAAPADKTRLLFIAESWLNLAGRVARKSGKRRNGDAAEHPLVTSTLSGSERAGGPKSVGRTPLSACGKPRLPKDRGFFCTVDFSRLIKVNATSSAPIMLVPWTSKPAIPARVAANTCSSSASFPGLGACRKSVSIAVSSAASH